MAHVLRLLLAALVLPALAAPKGLAFAWCLCTAGEEACCGEVEPVGCCGDDAPCDDDACDRCGELEADGPEPLLAEAPPALLAVLSLWMDEPATDTLRSPPVTRATAGPAPPLERVQAGRGSGVLPLRI